MGVDLQNADARKNYLSEKLDDLMDGINDSYGTVLMDELISQLERTVSKFNDEVQILMGQLKDNSDRRDGLLEKIKTGVVEEAAHDTPESISDKKEMSAWELKLEEMEKK
ncbi:MAG TPA: hypothetical protein QGG35_02585 [Candidatus Marinimicrobia bacterium]|jgi:hypothetical protein|nr:hypothetical protein [Candidatus Neomarinimicrobiota bacterium]MDP7483616.1 hypothetical protein [Candidatus Neomarinimicrobiota bacterium]MDP7528778.1 hypothetical protein [Candidatus Neomarinimicrobiota bacterium]MDP7654382.1 hypothetical protein [Candidatus Neomarinimicrobiota bacterium]HJL84268.1 hypothetical protein [Candidatus Neomarinimicrobiota bacterium]|tara:strand:+ start:2660 stop:2989 length:330 start_codon:yes stop_codon:yes gene_type:complete